MFGTAQSGYRAAELLEGMMAGRVKQQQLILVDALWVVSRRALEIRFQHSLGRSVREEIERVRVNWIKQLLVETDLPVWKITEHAGFTSQSYLSRATGVTVTRFRREYHAS